MFLLYVCVVLLTTSGVAKTLLDEQLNYLNTLRSLVREQMQLAPKLGGERAATTNITEQGKALIKSELQKLYPGYQPVATLPNMLDYNINALAKETNIGK